MWGERYSSVFFQSSTVIVTVLLCFLSPPSDYLRFHDTQNQAMSQITSDQVQHIARLAKLRFTPQELADFTAQFNQIVSYVEQLEEADTEGVTPMTSSLEELNVMRDDTPGTMLPPTEALRNAPKKTEGFFSVPKVIGEIEE